MLPEYADDLYYTTHLVYRFFRDDIDKLMGSLYRKGVSDSEIYEEIYDFIREKILFPKFTVTGPDSEFIKAIIENELNSFDEFGDIVSFCVENYTPDSSSESVRGFGNRRKAKGQGSGSHRSRSTGAKTSTASKTKGRC